MHVFSSDQLSFVPRKLVVQIPVFVGDRYIWHSLHTPSYLAVMVLFACASPLGLHFQLLLLLPPPLLLLLLLLLHYYYYYYYY